MVATVVIIAAVIGATALGYTDKLGGTETTSADQCGTTEFDPENVDDFAESEQVAYKVPCVMWFDATQLDYSDGETVSTWTDESVNEFDAPVESGDPTWTSDYDGVAAIEFDRTKDENFRTDVSPSDAGLAGDTEITVISVSNPTDPSEGHTGDGWDDRRRAVFDIGDRRSGGGSVMLQRRRFDDEWRADDLGSWEVEDSSDSWTVHTVTYDGDQMSGYANGKRVAQSDASLDIVDHEIAIGYSKRYSSVTHMDGAIAEVVIFDRALTDSERQSIECKLDKKHGGAVNVNGC